MSTKSSAVQKRSAMLALQRTDRGRRQALLAGLWLGLAVIMRPTNAILAAIFLIWLSVRRPRLAIPAGAGLLLVLVPFFVLSRWQYEQFTPPYHLPSRLEDAANFGFWESLDVNSVSPSRGMILYDPVLILGVLGTPMAIRRKTLTEVDGLLVASCIGQFLIIASYGSTGGSTYGPRLMIDIIPFLVVLASPTFSIVTNGFRGRKTVLTRIGAVAVSLVLVWGLFVNATGGLMGAGFCWSATPVQIDQDPDRVWDWSDPQFLRSYADLADGRSVSQVVAGSCSVN